MEFKNRKYIPYKKQVVQQSFGKHPLRRSIISPSKTIYFKLFSNGVQKDKVYTNNCLKG
jgi:hypothetical protein